MINSTHFAARHARKHTARTSTPRTTASSVAAIVALALGMTVAFVGAAPASSSRLAPTPVPASVLRVISSIPRSVFAAVETPRSLGIPSKIANPPAATLTGVNHEVKIVYVGAEYCPFCAAETWGLVVALSRFGSFTGLGATQSSSRDYAPNTNTFSFHGATFTSRTVDFTGVELAGNTLVDGRYPTLDSLTQSEETFVNAYDRAPYTTQAGSIPFIDIGNRYVMVGASYDPTILKGLSSSQIAGALSNPRSPVAQAVDGTANAFTAIITKLTGVRPVR